MQTPLRYARIERERRFLLDRFPTADIVRVRHITDRYIDGTHLRLREQTDDESATTLFKLTQKLPAAASGSRQGLVTTLFLTESEFHLLSQLPGKMLRKTRYSVPPLGIDVFEGSLHGLQLAEAEFNSDAEADAFIPPGFLLHEVTNDIRFTGGHLAHAPRLSVEECLAEFGIPLTNSCAPPFSIP